MTSARHGPRAWLAEADRVDRALYGALARTPTPLLDVAMRRLSAAADHSRLSILSSAALATTAGHEGRKAAAVGLSSVAVTSALTNLVVKPFGRRHRPNRSGEGVPSERHVPLPSSHSFPSGHTASAVAFASGAGRVLPVAGAPLHGLAALVAYSRVHTGVHYPGDVVAGAVLGAVVADLTAGAISRRRRDHG